MSELDELRQKRFEQLKRLQDTQAQQENQQEQLVNQITQLEELVRQHLTKEALSRYGNLKVAHPEKAIQVLVVLGKGIQSRKLKTIDDEMLKSVLQKMAPEKKEFKMRRS